MDEKRYDALERALVDISEGEELSSIIAANPELENALKTVELAQSLSPTIVPPAAVNRSRTRVLSRAMQLRQVSKVKTGIFQRIPRIAYALVLALIFLLSWNGLVFASGRALPGDQLYPAKLTLEKLRLGLTLNPQTHQKVEDEYQSRRIDEVVRLLALGRVEFVQFFGIVEQQLDDHWIIDGIEVRLLPETLILGDILPGMTVEVEGATQPEGWLQASEIHLQYFSIIGTVEFISQNAWTISGQNVLITSASQIDPEIQVGDIVIIDVSSDDFGILTAMLITLYGSETNGLQIIKIPEPTESPLNDITPEPDDVNETDRSDDTDKADELDDIDKTEVGEESDESDEQDESDESDESEEPEERDDPDETEEPDESEEPEERDDPDETEEPDESEELEETGDPDETDEPDESEEPEETGDPEVTDEPDESEEPDETEEPED